MSLRIIKRGLLDTVQDSGRYDYQHLGINPGGAMDRFSVAFANALLGKEENAAVIEMHFPAAAILFEEPTIICITGGHFSPKVNNVPVPLNQPIIVTKNSELVFSEWKYGTCCYLAFLHDPDIKKWLNSNSTNLKAKVGGWQGRSLHTADVIPFKREIKHFPNPVEFTILPWKAVVDVKEENQIQFIRGTEWNWLTKAAKITFTTSTFKITQNSDRMGYQLEGENMVLDNINELVSTGVNFGTIQVLPKGQLIILMADHQTTGGYPKVAHIISAHLSVLAQMGPGASFNFVETDLPTAEQKLISQKKYLQQLKNACSFKIENLLNAAI